MDFGMNGGQLWSWLRSEDGQEDCRVTLFSL